MLHCLSEDMFVTSLEQLNISYFRIEAVVRMNLFLLFDAAAAKKVWFQTYWSSEVTSYSEKLTLSFICQLTWYREQ